MSETIFMIDSVRFEPARKLLIGASGEHITLEDKIADLLFLLCQKIGDTVSREEIIAIVWKGRALSEQTVPVAISKLRKALREAGITNDPLQTIPKRGYVLVCIDSDSPVAARSHIPKWMVLSGLTALFILVAVIWPSSPPLIPAADAQKPGIILTVKDIRTELNGDQNIQRVIALSELMSYYLSQTPDVLVIRHWWNLDAPDPTGGIYTRYGTETPVYLLKGTLIEEGGQQLVALFLSIPRTEEVIWSGIHNVSSGVTGYFTVLETMFQRLDVHALTLAEERLSGDDRYWAGRYFMNLSNSGAAQKAAELFSSMVTDNTDTDDAGAALAALSARWPSVSREGLIYPLPSGSNTVAHLVDKAALTFYRDGNIKEALALIDTILASAPGDHYALSLKAEILAASGQIPEALNSYKIAARLAPFAKAYDARISELESN